RRPLRRDRRSELALSRGDGRRHRQVRPRRTGDREPLHRDGLVRAVLLVEAARLPEAVGDQHRRQPVRELAAPGPSRPVPDAPSALEVIRLRATRRWVILRGRVIAETSPARTTLLGEPVTFAPRADT